MKKQELKPSQTIEKFLNLLKGIENIHNCYEAKIKEQDELTQDFLHALELDNLNTGERSKLATQLKYNRQDRRYYKDRLEEIEPLYSFYCNNKKVVNDLQQTLGAVRKQEKYHADRAYRPRVLDKKGECK